MKTLFGRYSDAYKSDKIFDYWNKSNENFENKNYKDAYKYFLEYIKNDEGNNIKFSENDGVFDVQIIQGSKLIKVRINSEKITAESDIAVFEKPAIPFMRKLLDLNFGLFYSRFVLRDNMIVLKFDSFIIDCPPSKLFYALKEVSLKSDKQDDLLINEFQVLKPIFEINKMNLEEKLKEFKYSYFIRWINGTVNLVNTLNEKTYEGGISYLLLSLAYKLDYFIIPEGYLIERFEKIISSFYENDGKSMIDKNNKMKLDFQKFLAEPKTSITDYLFNTISTFSYLSPVPHITVVNLINDNLKNTKYYLENKRENIALSICEYIFGYSLYHYGLFKSLRKLFELGMILLNYDFYKESISGSKNYFDNNVLNKEEIIKEIQDCISLDTEEFNLLAFNTDNLKYTSLSGFIISFLNEVKNLNYNQ
jgi:hypothetical protein